MSSTSKKAAPPAATEPASKKRKMEPGEQKYYAVRAGFKPGVYTSWAICQQQITGFKGAQFKSFLSYEDASAFAAGRDPPPSASNSKPTRYYGVAVGRKPGVYTEWPAAQEAIVGWKRPKYRKFETRAEAEAFVKNYGTAGQTTKSIFAPVDGEEAEAEAFVKNYGTAGQTTKSIFAPVDGEEADGVEEPPAKKAKKSAKPANARNGVEVVYTDGSSLGNGRLGASAGVGVYFGEGDPRNISEGLQGEPQTNQRAELTAILRALETVDLAQDLEIRTDSKYSIQCVTEWYINWEKNGWKTRAGPVKNQDLVQLVRDKIEEREAKGGRTQFIWVKGHDTDVGNIAADRLAVAGASK